MKSNNCNNCKPRCNKEAVVYFKYIAKDKSLLNPEDWYVASCAASAVDYAKHAWAIISEEEYTIALVHLS
jgi:hypothetical protein